MDVNRQRYLSKQILSFQNNKKRNTYIYLCSLLIVISTIIQVWIIADLVSEVVVNRVFPGWASLIVLSVAFIIKAFFIYLREQIAFNIGSDLRACLRKEILKRTDQLGQQGTNQSPASLASFYMEQVEHLHHFIARFKPQMGIATLQPITILIVVFWYNWIAGLVLLSTIVVLPLFMIFIGHKTAQVNQTQVNSLLHLGSQFYDKIKGINTVISFNQQQKSLYNLGADNEEYREVTMKLLRIAFLNSAVLEFFTSLSIAIMAVYFGFNFMQSYSIGSYDGMTATLFVGFLCLTLAGEYYQPLRDLGAFYHDKSSAISAMNLIDKFLNSPPDVKEEYIYKPFNDNLEIRHTAVELEHQAYLENLARQRKDFISNPAIQHPLTGHSQLTSDKISFVLKDVIVIHPSGVKLSGPFSLEFDSSQMVVLIGKSGSGKSSLLSCLMGQYPYIGSITVNSIELSSLSKDNYLSQISWLGQIPNLAYSSILDNIVMGSGVELDYAQLKDLAQQLKSGYLKSNLAKQIANLIDVVGAQFILNRDLLAPLQEQKLSISIGQLQRIALIRALIKNHTLIFLDEPTASLDGKHQDNIFAYLQARGKGVVMITHHLDQISIFNKKFIITRDPKSQNNCNPYLNKTHSGEIE